MNTFHFQKPYFRLSTSPIIIRDNNQVEIGKVRRLYYHRVDQIMSLFIDRWAIDVVVESKDRVIRIQSKRISSWLRNKWTIHIQDQQQHVSFQLEDHSMVRMNPHFVFQLRGKSYSVKKKFANRQVTILDDDSGVAVAVIYYESMLPIQITRMTLELKEDSSLSPYEAICVYYILDLSIQ
ncbi:hypothetical protein [Paenibacillus sp. YYML68]|uniref:tubby C-terminal domain-like protein n=1 Tax=Paenibacillus sp. YYML68 TaxID=2909250 RepID=UPI0024932872|nr:hypothetical protein [Paenibacillus sp. YYML68]